MLIWIKKDTETLCRCVRCIVSGGMAKQSQHWTVIYCNRRQMWCCAKEKKRSELPQQLAWNVLLEMMCTFWHFVFYSNTSEIHRIFVLWFVCYGCILFSIIADFTQWGWRELRQFYQCIIWKLLIGLTLCQSQDWAPLKTANITCYFHSFLYWIKITPGRISVEKYVIVKAKVVRKSLEFRDMTLF